MDEKGTWFQRINYVNTKVANDLNAVYKTRHFKYRHEYYARCISLLYIPTGRIALPCGVHHTTLIY